MIVGVPKEVKEDEYRVAITPAGVRELTAAGHTGLRRAGRRGRARPSPTPTSSPPGPRSWTTRDDIWAASDLVLGVKEPIAEEYPRLGLRKDQVLFTYLHLAASRACTDALVAGGQHGHRLRDGAPARQLAAPAHPDERGGRPDGARSMGCPPPDAPGRRSGDPGLRGARRALRQGRHPRRRRGRHGRGHPGRRAARRGLHPRPQPRAPPPGRPPLPGRPRDGGLEHPRHRGVPASTPTSSSAPCWWSGPGRPSWSPTTWWPGCGTGSVLVDISVDQGGCFESTRPDHPLRSRPSRSTARSSTAWPTCPGPCPTRRPTRWSTPPCPTCSRSPTTGGATRCRADAALAEGVNVVEGAVVYRPVAEAHGTPYTPLETLLG